MNNATSSSVVKNNSLVGVVSKTHLEYLVNNYLIKLGIQSHLMGYGYLKEAIFMIINNENLVYCVSKAIVPVIARNNGTSPGSVERCVRNALDIAWKEGGNPFFITMFQGIINSNENKRPGFKQFIATVAQEIRLNELGGSESVK